MPPTKEEVSVTEEWPNFDPSLKGGAKVWKVKKSSKEQVHRLRVKHNIRRDYESATRLLIHS